MLAAVDIRRIEQKWAGLGVSKNCSETLSSWQKIVYLQLDTALPVHRPRFDMTNNNASSTQLSCTWIGHATTVVQIDGINVITDPVWADRAGPARLIGPVRYRPPPCAIAKLPPVGDDF
jgi:hypothetical protein